MIVADTNVLFSFFSGGSFTRKFLLNNPLEIISPEKSLEEINKHSELIMKKTGLNKNSFKKEFENLKTFVRFVCKKEYKEFMKEAEMISPDKNDINFIALSLKHNCLLWSNDSLLKNQNKVKVVSTQEFIEMLF